MLYYMGFFSSARVVRYHYDSLAGLGIQAFHQIQYLPCGNAVKVACRLIGHKYGRVGYYCARYGNALLLSAGELARVMVHPVGKPDY